MASPAGWSAALGGSRTPRRRRGARRHVAERIQQLVVCLCELDGFLQGFAPDVSVSPVPPEARELLSRRVVEFGVPPSDLAKPADGTVAGFSALRQILQCIASQFRVPGVLQFPLSFLMICVAPIPPRDFLRIACCQRRACKRGWQPARCRNLSWIRGLPNVHASTPRWLPAWWSRVWSTLASLKWGYSLLPRSLVRNDSWLMRVWPIATSLSPLRLPSDRCCLQPDTCRPHPRPLFRWPGSARLFLPPGAA